MLFYCSIVIGATVISITYAESASNQAISSQSYERGDVPLFYKHDVIHIFTTSKPHVYSNHQPQQQHQYKTNIPPQIENYRHIQYAPLPLKSPMQENRKEIDNETYISDDKETNVNPEPHQEQAGKNYIVPQFIPTHASNVIRTDFVQYAPGYNMNAQTLNNNVIHNRLYATPNLLIKHKQVNPQFHHHNQERLQDVRQNVEIVVSKQYFKPNAINTMLAPQFVQNDNKFNGNLLQSIENSGNLNPIFYVKAPKVSLNVARSNNIAHTPHKASLNVNSSFRKLPQLPQKYFNSQIVEFQNPQINPSPKNNVYMIHHTV